MATYHVNRVAQNNGDHEVHGSICSYLPATENRILPGEFSSCAGAVKEARRYYSQVNGCYHCSRPCHTS